jgi:hypothetical protein
MMRLGLVDPQPALFVRNHFSPLNVKELHVDTQPIINDITGLTARQRQLLEIAVRMSADRLLEMGESGAAAFMQECR